MYVLSAVEMQACDQLTSEQFGVPSGELMRAAANTQTLKRQLAE